MSAPATGGRPTLGIAVYRPIAVLVLAVLLTACDSSPAIPTTAPPDRPSTTTTIDNDTCGRVAQDTARYLETVILVLDRVTLDEVRDRDAWPEALIALQQQGEDLDTRADALRCDPADLQATAFQLARLDAESDLARYLLELLGRR